MWRDIDNKEIGVNIILIGVTKVISIFAIKKYLCMVIIAKILSIQ